MKNELPLEIVWSPLAQARLLEIRAFVSIDKPEAAERIAIRIVSLVEALRYQPGLGRVGPQNNYRELIVGGTPYIIFYRVRGKYIIINTIWHSSQSR